MMGTSTAEARPDRSAGGARRRISVVIPFYNSDPTLPETLASVLCQTRPADEIVVVDDCSSPALSTTLLQLPAGVRLIRQPRRRGTGPARQAGAEQTTGDWIACLDADDTWAPEKLARQEAELDRQPDLAALHTGTVIVSHGVRRAQYLDKSPRPTLAEILRRSEIIPSSLIVRRDVLVAIGGWTPERYVLEDWDLSIRLLEHGAKVGFVAEPLTFVRRDDHGNITSSPWRDLLINLACIDSNEGVMTRELGPAHVARLQAELLMKFGHRLGGWPGRFVRIGARLLARRL